MTLSPETLAELQRLRNAAIQLPGAPDYTRFMGPCPHGRDPWDRCDTCCDAVDFYRVAYEALGPDGCATKALERGEQNGVDWEKAVIELAAFKSECALLHQRCEKLESENKRMLQHVKGAQKENAVLLARLEKLSATAEAHANTATIETDATTLAALHAVLNEIPPREA